jgi:hypothetical protein
MQLADAQLGLDGADLVDVSEQRRPPERACGAYSLEPVDDLDQRGAVAGCCMPLLQAPSVACGEGSGPPTCA